METRSESRSIAQMVTGLISDVSTLVQQEISLARSEITERVSKAGMGIGTILFGGAILYAGITLMLFAAVIELAQLLPMWLAALAIGALVAIVGGIVMLVGRRTLGQVSAKPGKK